MRDCPFPVLLMLLSISIMLIGMALVIDDNDFGVLMAKKHFSQLLQVKQKLNNSYETEVDFYFYNITNPEEVERGNQAKTEQVGPFRYVKNPIRIDDFNNSEGPTLLASHDFDLILLNRKIMTLPYKRKKILQSFAICSHVNIVRKS